MDWYGLLREIECRPAVANLATGAPLPTPALERVWRTALTDLGHDGAAALGRYGPAYGDWALRESLVEMCARLFGRVVTSEEACVVAGGQAGLAGLQRMALRRGPIAYTQLEFPGAWNEVPVSQRVTYGIRWTGARTVRRPTLETDAPLDGQFASAIISRPHSPTGWAWTAADLMPLAERVHAARGLLVLDETYALPLAPLGGEVPEPFDMPATIHLYSFSKVGLAGERIGVAVGPPDHIRELQAIVERSMIRVATTSQWLATALMRALSEDRALAAEIVAPYRRRWSRIHDGLAAKGVLGDRAWLSEWSGAPFAWCGWRGRPAGVELAEHLLERGIAVAPDAVFAVSGTPRGWAGIRVGLAGGAPRPRCCSGRDFGRAQELTNGPVRTGHFGYRAVLADPYPVYRRLRDQGPIHWDEGERGWLVTAYDTAVALLKQDARMRAGLDRSGFVDQWPQARNEALAIRRHFDAWPLFASGAAHARVKETMRGVYTPALAARIRARAQHTAIALLRHESQRTRFDALQEYALPIARAALAELLVVPAHNLDNALHWSNRLLRFMNTRPELEDVRATARAIEEFTAWSIELCARQGLPPDSVPGALHGAGRDGRLSDDEMTAIVAQNVTGALGALAQLLANGLLALLRQRDAFGCLTADTSLGRRAAEEILRFEPPFLLIPRQAKDSFDVASVRIAAGDPVGILIGAANRDPARFDTPERIDLTRSRNPHISFGFGPHYCPGSGAARAVVEVALTMLARHRPGLMLAGEPPRVPLFGMRWLESLAVDDE